MRITLCAQQYVKHFLSQIVAIAELAWLPLLLRPLLAGDCDLDNDFDVGGDGSVQLLQAAAAANHAQAIVITLLEEYENIFGDVAVTHEPYTDDSEESGSESEEITDDDDDSFDDDDDDDDDDVTEDSNSEVDDDFEHESSSASSETGENRYCEKVSERCSSGSNSPQVGDTLEDSQKLSPGPPQTSSHQHDILEGTDNVLNPDDAKIQSNHSIELGPILLKHLWSKDLLSYCKDLYAVFGDPLFGDVLLQRRTYPWNPLNFLLMMRNRVSILIRAVLFPSVAEIQKLEGIKTDLQTRISNEAMANSLLQDSLEKRKHDLHERRLALEKDVARLKEQLQKEMDLRKALEAGLRKSQLTVSVSSLVDEKMLANLKKNAEDLEFQLNQQREQNSRIGNDIGNQPQQNPNHQPKSKEKQKDGGVLAISSTSENLSSRSKQADATQNPKAAGNLNMTSNVEFSTNKLGMTVSRKSSTRGEGTNSTTSALSKLTNRLNFLKERRSQMASELMDKARSSSQPVQNLPVQNLEQCAGSERRQLVENLDNHQESKGQSSENSKQRTMKVYIIRMPKSSNMLIHPKGSQTWTEENLEASRIKVILNFLPELILDDACSHGIYNISFYATQNAPSSDNEDGEQASHTNSQGYGISTTK
ncbi:hypothetical protein DH2020_008434 [Rehmannia glutinosa]|uniref:Ternary complex factor MIP1 leucine-zipper domain-containing protein n=1 Tax=Rehmannia glutinosa TaxID=99300 RepID=A0ABR0U124_REHGL